MTTGSVFVGASAVYAAVHNHNRQLNAQIFLNYSDRLQVIRRSMRSDLMLTRQTATPDDQPQDIPVGALETLHLIFELFELKDQGYVTQKTWTVWSRDINRFLASPIIQLGRDQIAQEFDGHTHFMDWIDSKIGALSATA
ncbi:hypothetical protein AQZ49_06240 [Novosphingobium sp. FSW06-99]|nr:hypothetical protein AQZ49_06240 [Novosphingobium sp. FSW06-99]